MAAPVLTLIKRLTRTAIFVAVSLAGEAIPAEIHLRIDARPLDEPIQLDVLVEESGEPIAGLSLEDFAVILDGEPVTAVELIQPRSLGGDLQVSAAIVAGNLGVAPNRYAALIRRLISGDQVAVVRYYYRPNGERSLLFMSTVPFLEIDDGANTDEMIRLLNMGPESYASWSLGSGSPSSPTLHALDEIAASQSVLPAGPRVLIGATVSAGVELEQLIGRAIENDVSLFNVAYAEEWLENFLAKRAATRETGGALVIVNDETQDDLAVSRIGDWLNNSFRLVIPAATVNDCDLHAVEITVESRSAVLPFSRCDTTPDLFAFEVTEDVEPGVIVVSPAVTITGIESPAPVEVFGGEYSIGCGAEFTSEPGYLQPHDAVCVRHVSSQLPNDLAATVLSVGSGSGRFESLTRYFQQNSPPPRPPSGGGGSTGWIELLLLGVFATRAALRAGRRSGSDRALVPSRRLR